VRLGNAGPHCGELMHWEECRPLPSRDGQAESNQYVSQALADLKVGHFRIHADE